MADVLILRGPSTEHGTFGQLIMAGFTCVTLERPWLNNKSSVSSIPAGKYKCLWTYSPRFKKRVYLVDAVPGRSGIRIHPANLASQLNGCIALGEKFGVLGGVPAILTSAPAVRQFETLWDGRSFTLEIKNA